MKHCVCLNVWREVVGLATDLFKLALIGSLRASWLTSTFCPSSSLIEEYVLNKEK